MSEKMREGPIAPETRVWSRSRAARACEAVLHVLYRHFELEVVVLSERVVPAGERTSTVRQEKAGGAGPPKPKAAIVMAAVRDAVADSIAAHHGMR